MATDDTRPKVRMLFTIGVVSVFLLLGVKFVLDSYYLDMTETFEHSLLPPTTLRDDTKREQLDAIDKGQNGTIPVSIAMQTLATKGRDNASTDITPQPSDDIDPLKGWAQLKREVHLPPQSTTAPQQEAAPSDAGAAAAGDAGALPTMAADGGARPRAADGGAPRTAPPHAAPKDGGK